MKKNVRCSVICSPFQPDINIFNYLYRYNSIGRRWWNNSCSNIVDTKNRSIDNTTFHENNRMRIQFESQDYVHRINPRCKRYKLLIDLSRSLLENLRRWGSVLVKCSRGCGSQEDLIGCQRWDTALASYYIFRWRISVIGRSRCHHIPNSVCGWKAMQHHNLEDTCYMDLADTRSGKP